MIERCITTGEGAFLYGLHDEVTLYLTNIIKCCKVIGNEELIVLHVF